MTAQTPKGLTYPQPGDHTRLWEHFQELAEDVDGLVTGSVGYPGYTSINPVNNWGNPGQIRAVRSGAVVNVLASHLRENFATNAGQNHALCNLPDDLRPTYTVYVPAISNAVYDVVGRVTISPDGAVTLRVRDSITSPGWTCQWTATYMSAFTWPTP